MNKPHGAQAEIHGFPFKDLQETFYNQGGVEIEVNDGVLLVGVDDRDNLDNGGVHLNSGIPNHAFYLVATEIGGHAWEKAGLIWYIALRDRLTPTSQFKDTAKATFDTAGAIYGDQSKEQKAVQKGWEAVGVTDWNNIGIEKGIKK